MHLAGKRYSYFESLAQVCPNCDVVIATNFLEGLIQSHSHGKTVHLCLLLELTLFFQNKRTGLHHVTNETRLTYTQENIVDVNMKNNTLFRSITNFIAAQCNVVSHVSTILFVKQLNCIVRKLACELTSTIGWSLFFLFSHRIR